MNLRKIVLGALSALVLCNSAAADPITWALNGVSFADGGILSGSFSTDQSTGAILSFDLSSSGGTVLQPFHYTNANSFGFASPFFANTYEVIVSDNSRYVSLGFDQLLTSAGTFAITVGSASYECLNCNPYRFVTTGSVTAVPEPSTYGLLIGGSLLVGFWSRRRGRLSSHTSLDPAPYCA